MKTKQNKTGHKGQAKSGQNYHYYYHHIYNNFFLYKQSQDKIMYRAKAKQKQRQKKMQSKQN